MSPIAARAVDASNRRIAAEVPKDLENLLIIFYHSLWGYPLVVFIL
jgi:hypothetical protein